MPYVVAVAINVGGESFRIDDVPSVLFEQLAVLRLVAGQRQLERGAAPRRQRQEFEELEMLAPVVRLAFERDLAPELLPPGNRGEPVAPAGAFAAPLIEQHRLTCRPKREPFGNGQPAIALSVVGCPREKRDVRLEKRVRFRRTFAQLQLGADRTGPN